MSSETRRLVREGFGAIADELRLQRGKLDYLIENLVTGENGVHHIKADYKKLQDKVAELERRFRAG